jgi:transposase
MATPLSNDLRRRIVEAVDGGMSRRAAAERFGVSASTAIRLVERWRRHGCYEARTQGGDKRSARIEAFREDIFNLLDNRVDITLAEIADHLLRVYGAGFALSTIWRFLDRHEQTYKKNRARQRAGSARRRGQTARLAPDPTPV